MGLEREDGEPEVERSELKTNDGVRRGGGVGSGGMGTDWTEAPGIYDASDGLARETEGKKGEER